MAAGKEGRVFKGHSGTVCSASFSPDGAWLVGGDSFGKLTFWGADSGRVLASPRVQEESVSSLSFAPGSSLFASGGEDGAKLWSLQTKSVRTTLEGDGRAIDGVALAKGGRLLATVSHDRFVRVWETATGKGLIGFKMDRPAWSVAFSPDGRTLVAGDSRGEIRAWAVGRLLDRKTKE